MVFQFYINASLIFLIKIKKGCFLKYGLLVKLKLFLNKLRKYKGIQINSLLFIVYALINIKNKKIKYLLKKKKIKHKNYKQIQNSKSKFLKMGAC